jgi:hypothetical protein
MDEDVLRKPFDAGHVARQQERAEELRKSLEAGEKIRETMEIGLALRELEGIAERQQARFQVTIEAGRVWVFRSKLDPQGNVLPGTSSYIAGGTMKDALQTAVEEFSKRRTG